MSKQDAHAVSSDRLLAMAADVVSAYVGNHHCGQHELPDIIQAVYGTLHGLGDEPSEERKGRRSRAAVPVKKSVTPDYLICLEDGKKLKMLKRHLRTNYDLSPEQYRLKWGLPSDYPMVAPNYAAQRSAFAKKIGLGRNGRRV